VLLESSDRSAQKKKSFLSSSTDLRPSWNIAVMIRRDSRFVGQDGQGGHPPRRQTRGNLHNLEESSKRNLRSTGSLRYRSHPPGPRMERPRPRRKNNAHSLTATVPVKIVVRMHNGISGKLWWNEAAPVGRPEGHKFVTERMTEIGSPHLVEKYMKGRRVAWEDAVRQNKQVKKTCRRLFSGHFVRADPK